MKAHLTHLHIAGTLALAAAACAPTIKDAAREASGSATDEAVKQVSEPETRQQLSALLNDPQLADAIGKLSGTVATSMLQQLSGPDAQRELGQLTQTMTRSVILGTAHGLEHDLGPALRTTIERDVSAGMAASLNGPLRTAMVDTTRTMMSEGVNAAMTSARSGISGIGGPSSALTSDVRSTLDLARQVLLTLAVLAGLSVLALLCGALVAIARTRRTRAETERLESTLQLVLSAVRETQGQPASGEVLEILRANLHTDHGRSSPFRAQA